MICPLMSRPKPSEFTECLKEQCAWWIIERDKSRCAIRILAETTPNHSTQDRKGIR